MRKKVLIVSTTGLEEALWATPALEALAKSDSIGEISLLTTSLGKEALSKNPHLSEIFVLQSSFFFLLYRLWRKRFDTVLLFDAPQKSVSTLLSLIGAKEILRCMKEGHEIKKRILLVAKAGGSSELFPLSYHFQRKTRQELHLPTSTRLIALNPGGGKLFKQWPVSSFVEVGKKLRELFGATLVIAGSPAETTLVHEVADKIEGAIPFCEKKELSSLASLLSEVDLFITGDGGPMQMAFALETPTIALFAPSSSQLRGPIGGAHWKLIAKPRTCTPCLREKCLLPFCMRQISPAEVLNAAISFLKR